MQPTFKEFDKNNTITENGIFELKGSIPHIESLPIDEFIHTIENLTKYTITEKIDGNNIIAGYDNDGRFYTSRESKGGQRFYNASEYPEIAANNSFRSAHLALESHPSIKQEVGRGNQVECELLCGRQPNAIVYGENHITFLRGIPGDSKQAPSVDLMERLKKNVCGYKITPGVSTHVLTEDGDKISTKSLQLEWNLSTTSTVDPESFDHDKLKKQIAVAKNTLNFVRKNGLTVRENLDVKLNKLPKDKREEAKQIREMCTTVVNLIKSKMKETLLETLQSHKPALRTVEVESYEDHGIEGVVVLCSESLKQVKIVDKENFTAINKFNFAVRNQIKATSHVGKKSPNLLERVGEGDVYGRMLSNLAEHHGCDDLGDYLSITRFLKKHQGDTILYTLNNVMDQLSENVTVGDLQDTITAGLVELHTLRKEYSVKWNTLEHKLNNGKTIKYNESVHERNLMFFAEVNQELEEINRACFSCQNVQEVIATIFSKQLQSIHS